MSYNVIPSFALENHIPPQINLNGFHIKNNDIITVSSMNKIEETSLLERRWLQRNHSMGFEILRIEESYTSKRQSGTEIPIFLK
jgi:hypothetical protein